MLREISSKFDGDILLMEAKEWQAVLRLTT